jgi:hypothetical protein
MGGGDLERNWVHKIRKGRRNEKINRKVHKNTMIGVKKKRERGIK